MNKTITTLLLVSATFTNACGRSAYLPHPELDESELSLELEQEDDIIGHEKQVGGGAGYDDIVTEDQASIKVHSYEELAAAVEVAQPGATIFIPNGEILNFTNKPTIVVDKPMTIASDRGENGSLGALILTQDIGIFPLIKVTASDVRISGIRFVGADSEVGVASYDHPLSMAIKVTSHYAEVDNCDISAFSYAGIMFEALDLPRTGHYVHHNRIHHIRRYGLGYGVSLHNAEALIEYNYFEKTRHAVAGSGLPRTGYEARYNTIGEGYQGASHTFDMHRMEDNPAYEGNQTSGNNIYIHHNNIMNSFSASVLIKGYALGEVEIHHNLMLGYSLVSEIQLFNPDGARVYENELVKVSK